MMRFWAN